MNQPAAISGRLHAAACPLLAAVLPVRYAIGPVDPRHPTSLDAATLGLQRWMASSRSSALITRSCMTVQWAMCHACCVMGGCICGMRH